MYSILKEWVDKRSFYLSKEKRKREAEQKRKIEEIEKSMKD